MNIAILGATSQIAKDLIVAFAKQDSHELALKQEAFFVPNN
jgi:hypothetical protein